MQTDMTIYKNTSIAKSVLQLRFEFYNLFNHPNFTNVVNDLSAGNFGRCRARRCRDGGR
jgi:hypothetical protein